MTDFAPSDEVLSLSIEQLWIYPIKSCAGIRLPQAELQATGLEWDRAWMVVDDQGEFVSQRDLPRMALVQPRFHLGQLELTAPGMLPLHVALVHEEPLRRRVRVWDDEVLGQDMGDAAARWFSQFLMPDAAGGELPLRLVRFDPQVRRLSSTKWTHGVEAPNQFNDGFPVLVMSSASLADLNDRLLALGQPTVGVERFRPNVVLGGLESHDEDRMAHIYLPLADGSRVHLQPVKPCARCSVPDINPSTAQSTPVVNDVLRTYRQDRRLMGAVTFGMNAIVRAGVGAPLYEGMAGYGEWNDWDV